MIGIEQVTDCVQSRTAAESVIPSLPLDQSQRADNIGEINNEEILCSCLWWNAMIAQAPEYTSNAISVQLCYLNNDRLMCTSK